MMADQHQRNLLKQGADTWNTWRTTHPDVPIHLSRARLYGADLSGTDLSDADLSGAKLRRANLSDADLTGADLSGAELVLANLTRTKLSRAILSRAILSRAIFAVVDLSEADLSEAELIDANLSGVNLSGANLSGANLSNAHLFGADLSRANLSKAVLNYATLTLANLTEANLSGAKLGSASIRRINYDGSKLDKANFTGANFTGVDFSGQDLSELDFSGQDFSGANLSNSNLTNANLSGANLSGANLSSALLIGTNLERADLTECSIHGVAVWNVQLKDATQSNLVITGPHEPTITVDNLKVAQFIYLLLNNQEIREVINTIGQKGVLILGRFSQERKLVLDALREKLRTLNFLPIIFDFERPTERDITETIMTLAGLCSFIIADITNPKSSPLELQATVPDYMIPFVPLIQKGEQPFSMFKDLKNKYNWVLDPLAYDTPSTLIKVLEIAVVKPALEKRAELLAKKVEQVRTRDADDYLKQLL